MKNAEINSWITTLGWTLLHSLWQGMAVALLYVIVRQLAGKTRAAVHYAISSGALLLLFIASVSTFIFIKTTTVASLTPAVAGSTTGVAFSLQVTAPSVSYGEQAAGWINNHLLFIVFTWLTGVLIFSLRLLGAWWASSRLKSSAVRVTGHWEERLSSLAAQLGVKGELWLTESVLVRSPMVLGYLKPVILLPIGMLSGLSTEQIESILLHELAHIRRHDYLINILQSIMEVVMFFNPFVWLISGRMRTEREQCCDDVVIQFTNPLTYARALHQLEEERLSAVALGMAAVGTKNQLLQRIKRIMETTEKKETGTRKVVPALLVIAALIGGSWISVQAHRPEVNDADLTKGDSLAADTTIKGKPNQKSMHYSRKSVITYDEKGKPHEEITEESSGDLIPLKSLMNTLTPMADVPEMPEIPDEPMVAMPSFPSFDPIAPIAPIPDMNLFSAMVDPNGSFLQFFKADTLPGVSHLTGPDLDEFNRKFTEQFKNRFAEFYKMNGPEMEKMMKDLAVQMEAMQEKMHIDFEPRELARLEFIEAETEARAEQRVEAQLEREMARMESNREQLQEQQGEREEARRESENRRLNSLADRADAERDRDRAEDNDLGDVFNKLNSFNQELRKELVKDKYLTPTEELTSLNWNEDQIEVNEKKISAKDAPKYNDMLNQYLKNKSKDKHKDKDRTKTKEKAKNKVGSAQ